MVKLSDYIIKVLVKHGVTDIFMISGGGAMHLVDSVGKEKKIKYYCPHHEQAAAMAAEGYSRVSGKMGVVVVTSGPGGTNTITGVIQQWLDSIPCLYISGQIKEETSIISCPEVGLRQLGDQEINIVDIVRPVTKYAVMVRDPLSIRYHLEKAIYLATHGRQGPVWLDIPLNVQPVMIDENRLEGFNPDIGTEEITAQLSKQISEVLALLKKAERPVFLAGHGIRLSGAQDVFNEFINKFHIPVLTTFCGFDLIPSNHPLYAGRVGTLGNRFGNFALQNADLLLSVGSRNNIRQVSYNWKVFARDAKKVIVDIDPAELKKPTLKPDIAIQADAGVFLTEVLRQSKAIKFSVWDKWLNWCMVRKDKYPVVLKEYWKNNKPVNPYCFIDALTNVLKKDTILISANGTACVTLFQAGIVKEGQRMFWNSGCASMGYDLPASIGACIANNKKPVICLAGDGSLQMNIQELQTIITYNLPIKIFVFNNNGYVSMRQTQDAFFSGRYTASGPESGVKFPDILKLAKVYGFKTRLITAHNKMKSQIEEVLKLKGPVLCEVKTLADYKFIPKVSSLIKPDGKLVSKPLEDMFPFLSREEFYSNMLIKPLSE